MAAIAIPAVKATIRTWSVEEAQAVAEATPQLEDTASVRKLLEERRTITTL